jgi:hypothetical protein
MKRCNMPIKETLYEYIAKICIGLGQGSLEDAIENFADIWDDAGGGFAKKWKRCETWRDKRLFEVATNVINNISLNDGVVIGNIATMSVCRDVRCEIAKLVWKSVAGDKIDMQIADDEKFCNDHGETPAQMKFDYHSNDMWMLGAPNQDPKVLKLRAERIEIATERQIIRVGMDNEKLAVIEKWVAEGRELKIAHGVPDDAYMNIGANLTIPDVEFNPLPGARGVTGLSGRVQIARRKVIAKTDDDWDEHRITRRKAMAIALYGAHKANPAYGVRSDGDIPDSNSWDSGVKESVEALEKERGDCFQRWTMYEVICALGTTDPEKNRLLLDTLTDWELFVMMDWELTNSTKLGDKVTMKNLNDKFHIQMSRWNKMLGKKPPPLVDTKPIRRQSTMVNGKEGPPKLFRGWGAVVDVQTANEAHWEHDSVYAGLEQRERWEKVGLEM